MRAESPGFDAESIGAMNGRRLREGLVRGFCRLVARSLFRIRLLGTEHAPLRGPALLVSNHLTYLDGFVIAACVRPVVRFVVWKPYYDRKLWIWALRAAKAIPIGAGPRGAAQAIKIARGALESADVVCIFPEGAISRTGYLLPFKRGVEAISNGRGVPVIPVHLGGLWDSIFSFKGGRFFWKWPRYLRHPVFVTFGTPIPGSATAAEVRDAVGRLGSTTPDASGA